MKIENNKMVSLIYELRENDSDGKIIETLDENRPLKFIYGTGRLLPFFESNISLLREGDLFRFKLNSEMAYGDKREEMIINVPLSVFETDGKLNEDICRVGNEVPMSDSEGNPLTGVINEITDAYVKMDFNHPMAGLDLFFSGKIVDVREATDNELAATTHSCSGCGSGEHSGCGTEENAGCVTDEQCGCSGSCG
jgi:FKBP-type peptidyl-prolyl cis-trans isomerase SlyD